jgi:imidazolonepropionase-like amidohydrolase
VTLALRDAIGHANLCDGADGVRAALLVGVDSIEHGTPFTDEIIELFRWNPAGAPT